MEATLTPEARAFVDDMAMHHPTAVTAAIREPERRNLGTVSMFNRFVEEFSPEVGWWNEDDPESPVEVIFTAPEGAGFETGVRLGEYVSILFANFFEFQSLDETSARVMFDNPDELATGDRVRDVKGRTGVVTDFRREDEDEPRTLQMLVALDGTQPIQSEWILRVDLERA